MLVEQRVWTQETSWVPDLAKTVDDSMQLVFVFGARSILKNRFLLKRLKDAYPSALLFGCSTAGEIAGCQVFDNSIVATACHFEHTAIECASIRMGEVGNSFNAGQLLAEKFSKEGLKHVLVLSDGIKVNGSDLVKGLIETLPKNVIVTGGLAGDGMGFKETVVLLDGLPEKEVISALGFYGDRIAIGYGSLGGWDPFGPYRLITRSEGNVLYELDGKSALDLYKKYLGEYAKGLPATGLLFPLSIKPEINGEPGIIRTILSVNEEDHSMTFAGDVPQGSYVRLMKATYDKLVNGAIGAAELSFTGLGRKSPDLAILISCVGRKMVLKQRTEEELEGVQSIFGERTILTGFYSYGEICPLRSGVQCELHNQTMTITAFLEK